MTLTETQTEHTGSWAGAIVVGTAVGTACGATVLPVWLSSWQPTLLGASPQVFWYLSRSSGIVAYLAFTLSMALGLITTNRLARAWPGGPLAVDLHEFLSLLGLSMALFHVLILLGDRWINYTLSQLLVPMTAEYRPAWVALGQIGLGLALPVALSFYVRRLIGYRAWRMLHGATFVVYVLLTLHGFGAGTDTPVLTGMYGSSVLLIVFLTTYRVLQSKAAARPGAETDAATQVTSAGGDTRSSRSLAAGSR